MPKPGKPLRLVGQRFGELVVLRRDSNDGKYTRWLCRCDCGKEKSIRGTRLVTGRAKTCAQGHISKALIMKVAPREYQVWRQMLWRVVNDKNYVRRGIKVCLRWQHLENFLSDMGPRPEGARYSIDRINNDGSYEPANCRWATSKQQNRNASKTVKIQIAGKTVTLIELTEQRGLSRQMVVRRIRRGWSVTDALSLPPKTWLARDDYPAEWVFSGLRKRKSNFPP